MSVALLPGIIPEFLVNGVPAAGAQLFTYAAGTTTKLASYTDQSGSTPQTNPIILNARGEPQSPTGNSVGIWLTQSTAYKFVLAPATDTDPPQAAIWTIDNVQAGVLAGTSYTASGTNAITLQPISGTPTLISYANYVAATFVAPATPTGPVTLQIQSLGFLPVYINGARAIANSYTAGELLTVYYNAALNSGNGGFVAVPSVTGTSVYSGTDTGAANAYVVNPTPPATSYVAGQIVVFVPANNNTGNSTVNVSSLGAITIVTSNGTGIRQGLVANQIVASSPALLIYDGVDFVLINPYPSFKTYTGVDSGSANTYVITTTPAMPSLVAGTIVNFQAATSSTWAGSTVNVSGTGAITLIRPDLNGIQNGDIVALGEFSIIYDGVHWQLLNPAPRKNTVVAFASITVSGGGVSILANSGFSSITRSSTGVYLFAFNSNVAPDGNYAVTATLTEGAGGGAANGWLNSATKASSGFQIYCTNTSGGAQDVAGVDVMVVR